MSVLFISLFWDIFRQYICIFEYDNNIVELWLTDDEQHYENCCVTLFTSICKYLWSRRNLLLTVITRTESGFGTPSNIVFFSSLKIKNHIIITVKPWRKYMFSLNKFEKWMNIKIFAEPYHNWWILFF